MWPGFFYRWNLPSALPSSASPSRSTAENLLNSIADFGAYLASSSPLMGLCTSSAFKCSLTCPDLPSNPHTFIPLGKYGLAGSLLIKGLESTASLLLIGSVG